MLPHIGNSDWRRYVHLHLGSLLPRICNSTASPLRLHLALLLHVPDVLPRTEFSVVVCVHANDISATQGDRMVYVGGLKERKNVVEVLGIAQAHGLAMFETPQPEGGRRQVVAKEDAFFSSVVVCSVCYVRMLTRQVPCHI